MTQITGWESLELLKFAFNCGNTKLAMKKKICNNYLALELGLVWLEKKSWTLKDYLLLVNKDASLIAFENLKTSLLKSSNGFSERKDNRVIWNLIIAWKIYFGTYCKALIISHTQEENHDSVDN